MRQAGRADVQDTALLDAAVGGDGDAYARLIAGYLPQLRVHCYRMLGSYHDAEEATQETMLRAWRSLPSYQARAPLAHWLYRIATTTCLMMIRTRSRRPVTVGEIGYLEPFPDRQLDELPADGLDPAAVVAQRESVALAFVAALQLLPATQRAVLILRDVLTLPSAEVAELLDSSVAAVNSALQRARTTLAANPAGWPAQPRPLTPTDRAVLDRFVYAWHRCDIDGLAALLHEDAVLRMPPQPHPVQGRDQIAQFFATVPAAGRLDQIRLRPTGANGQLALAAYLPDQTAALQPYGIMVFDTADARIQAITGFADPGLFAAFALPATGGLSTPVPVVASGGSA